MRDMFAEELYQNAIKDKSIYVIVADISPAGNMQNFQKKYPDRFVNVGVSEMTMIGMCAGLALEKNDHLHIQLPTLHCTDLLRW